MNDILDDLEKWVTAGEQISLATVIETWGSSPRQVGAKMAMTPTGKITGSVSGGCVEGAVYQAGVETIKKGQPQLLHFGVTDEVAWEVGLACGGKIDVFAQPLEEKMINTLSTCIKANHPLIWVNIINGPERLLGESLVICDREIVYTNLDKKLGEQFLEMSVDLLSKQVAQRMEIEIEDEGVIEFFFDVILPPPTLVIIGGVHIAIALEKIARVLDYKTIIIDPRASFGSLDRFPHVERLIQAWPDQALDEIELSERTAVVVLTHDPKIDDAALKIVVNSPVYYIGVLGSRTTQAKRRERLLNSGVSEAQIDRFHAPVGVDIGAKTPEEIALAIMAEIIAVRNREIYR
jgi:xanthine dehydrogenase accessory factor